MVHNSNNYLEAELARYPHFAYLASFGDLCRECYDYLETYRYRACFL